jgi:hypothetical protein
MFERYRLYSAYGLDWQLLLNAVSVFTRYVSDTKPLQGIKNNLNERKWTKHHLPFFIISDIFSSCSVQLASIRQVKEQIAANYKVLKNISYGSIKSKIWTFIFQRRKRNWVIKIHHFSWWLLPQWQIQEEKYIQPYLDKGMNVVNLNYRLKRGIPIATEDLTNALHFLKVMQTIN